MRDGQQSPRRFARQFSRFIPKPCRGAQWPISQVEKLRPTVKGVAEAARGTPVLPKKQGHPGQGQARP